MHRIPHQFHIRFQSYELHHELFIYLRSILQIYLKSVSHRKTVQAWIVGIKRGQHFDEMTEEEKQNKIVEIKAELEDHCFYFITVPVFLSIIFVDFP